MNPKLVARIKAPDTAGKSSIGTGYPISHEWVLTAAHVVAFDDRDVAPITVEWLSHKPVEVMEVKLLDNDIALLRCVVPAVIGTPIFLPIDKLPDEQIGWKSAGYPDVNGCNLFDAMGRFGVDLGDPTISLTLDDTCRRDEWGGMSGAPVFKGDRLCAVITTHDQRMGKRLNAVSIPWLLASEPEFQQAVGYSENSHHQQFFLDEILSYLKCINGLPLFLALAKRFVAEGLQSSAEALLSGLQVAVEDDPVAVIEKLRLLAEPIMAKDHASAEQAKTLLCLLLGLITAKNPANDQNIHNLAVYSRMMVEVSLAAHYKVRPDLEHVPDKTDVVGRYAIGGECLREVGWKTEDNTKEITKVVNVAVNKAYKRVHGSEPKETLGRFDLRALNTTLLTRRKNKFPELIRFEVETTDALKETHPLHDDDVCAALHHPACLPNLPIVRYGLEAATKDEDLEADLYALVNEFFRIIQQYS